MRVLGVDGAKGGWVVVALEDGRFVGSTFAESFSEVLADDAAVIGVDIPLGEVLPGRRRAEALARTWITPRHSSVFTPPPLAAGDAATYEIAKSIAHELTGKKITQQAWNLLPKMLEVTPHWQADSERIREVHPECAFRAMCGGPLHTKKKDWSGLVQRLRALRDHGIDLVDPSHSVAGARPDDVVDAAAVAWSAHRVATGRAASLPDPPERDADGRAVAIWY
jgi:predicted RNase H-like nuclease